MFAAEGGHTETAALLIERGTDIQAKDKVRSDASFNFLLVIDERTKISLINKGSKCLSIRLIIVLSSIEVQKFSEPLSAMKNVFFCLKRQC